MTRRPHAVVALAGVAVALALGGCSGSAPRPVAAATTPAASPSAPASTAPLTTSAIPAPTSTGPAAAANPLTGVGPRPTGAVVAVKVDNARSARPLQRGLADAAVVYQELIEGGATRYLAIFVGPGGGAIGPCRSARESDLQLLGEYGKVALGFSGANRHVYADVRRANVVELSQYSHPQLYDLRGRRPEAYNFYTTRSALIAAAKGEHPTGVRDVGFRFGALPAGTPAATVARAPFSSGSVATMSWDAGRHGWRLVQDGRPMDLADGRSVVPQNVVVQYVSVTKGAYHDVLGNFSPDSRTIGSGKALVFRDGHVVIGTWHRPAMGAPTHFLDAQGHDILLRPGQTWVMLVPAGAGVTFS